MRSIWPCSTAVLVVQYMQDFLQIPKSRFVYVKFLPDKTAHYEAFRESLAKLSCAQWKKASYF